MVKLSDIGNNIKKTLLGNSIGTGLFSWMSPGEWNRRSYLEQYTRYVYAVVSAIAEEAAKVCLEAYKVNADGTEVPVLKSPLLDLLKKPNDEQSQFQFLELHFTYMKLCGESFWYTPLGGRSSKPKEIHLLRPDMMDVVIDKESSTGAVSGYVLNKPDGNKVPFELNEIVHFKMPNPLNPKRGMGTVQAAQTYIETEEYAANWTKHSLFNSGRPSGILNIKGTIDKVAFEDIKRQFKEKYSGTKNAGKTMLMKGADGMDYQKLGMELGEVALKELKDMTRDDIMVMFRVSKTILGITDDVNRANAEASRAVFTQNIIKPELDRFVDHLNAFVNTKWNDGSYIDYEDMTMTSDADKMAEWTAGWNKWLTTNDIREERGLDPIDGGDELYIPVNLVPLSEAMLPPAPVTPPTPPVPPVPGDTPPADPNAPSDTPPDPNADTPPEPAKSIKSKKKRN